MLHKETVASSMVLIKKTRLNIKLVHHKIQAISQKHLTALEYAPLDVYERCFCDCVCAMTSKSKRL